MSIPERSTQLNFEECEPLDGEVCYLGQHHAPPPLEGSPRHHEAVGAFLLEKSRGWSHQLFDIYRCTVAYPILHSMVVLRESMRRLNFLSSRSPRTRRMPRRRFHQLRRRC